MTGRLFRLDPAGPVQAYKTYAIKAPLSSHWRKATCAEFGCNAHRNGWRTIVPVNSVQAQYIRAKSGRRFLEVKQDGGLAEFRFPPGQMCFKAAEHQVPLERPPLFVVRDGDWRGNPTGRSMRHRSAEDWRDDFGEHQQNIADLRQRG